MRIRRAVLVGAALALPCFAKAAIPIEQIEAYEDPSTTAQALKSHYAPIDFGGSATVAGTGDFNGITFHALDKITDTLSFHADAVGENMYGPFGPGFGTVTDVYSAAADTFIPNVVNPQPTISATGPAPGHFDGGAKVINNSYVDHEDSDLDGLRRFDFMIHRDDVTFVAGAVRDPASTTGLQDAYLDWSAYNSLAVTGSLDPFDPTGSPGKGHADLARAAHASFATAQVSGMASALYNQAQAASQTAAQHDVVMRSLLMTGADKAALGYVRQTANNLDLTRGAGVPSLAVSSSILQAGQDAIHPVIAGVIAGIPTTSPQGWSYDAIPAGGQSVVLFHANNTINGITATLNWDVDQTQPTAGEIDTTDAGTLFPDLGLEVRSLSGTVAAFTLNPSFSDTTLHSDAGAATSSPNDNVEHIYFTGTLPAGDYAFLIRGDSSLSPNVGFSYTVSEVPEPASMTLLGIGASLLMIKRRRQTPRCV